VRITVIGTGYVGLVTGTCLAEVGNDVLCLDVDPTKIETLKGGGIPIYEPGLEDMVKRNVAAGRLNFTTDIEESVAFGQIQFIAVGTPPDEDGSADLQYVVAAARNIGRYMTDYKLVVDKSTVPVGTADKVKAALSEELGRRGAAIEFNVASNPEFLKEGAAVDDFMKPDRIVIGTDSERATQLLRQLYAPFQRNHDRLTVMDVKSAELTKYAANAMLATRISFMNELAVLAEKLGADIEQVRHGIGSDPRIGYHFLYAGCGYGGSCFPKDVQALRRTGQENGIPLRVLDAVEEANDAQKQILVNKLTAKLGKDLEDFVGNTPLVRLQRLPGQTSNVILAKLEGNNPAGSVKDRPALSMIKHAEARGEIKPGDTLIEATSGNTGIALAMAATMKGYRMVLIMPEHLSLERRAVMKAFGAELVLVTQKQGMEGARDMADQMEREGKGKVS
jgi:UDPglucose 6-dehydrogenase